MKHQLKDAHQMNFRPIEDVSRPVQVLHLNNVEIFSLLSGILLFVPLVKLEFGQTLPMNVKPVPTTTLIQTMMVFKLGLALLANKTKSIPKRKVVSNLVLLHNLPNAVMFSSLFLIHLFVL